MDRRQLKSLNIRNAYPQWWRKCKSASHIYTYIFLYIYWYTEIVNEFE